MLCSSGTYVLDRGPGDGRTTGMVCTSMQTGEESTSQKTEDRSDDVKLRFSTRRVRVGHTYRVLVRVLGYRYVKNTGRLVGHSSQEQNKNWPTVIITAWSAAAAARVSLG